jgi:hypothetical protein
MTKIPVVFRDEIEHMSQGELVDVVMSMQRMLLVQQEMLDEYRVAFESLKGICGD